MKSSPILMPAIRVSSSSAPPSCSTRLFFPMSPAEKTTGASIHNPPIRCEMPRRRTESLSRHLDLFSAMQNPDLRNELSISRPHVGHCDAERNMPSLGCPCPVIKQSATSGNFKQTDVEGGVSTLDEANTKFSKWNLREQSLIANILPSTGILTATVSPTRLLSTFSSTSTSEGTANDILVSQPVCKTLTTFSTECSSSHNTSNLYLALQTGLGEEFGEKPSSANSSDDIQARSDGKMRRTRAKRKYVYNPKPIMKRPSTQAQRKQQGIDETYLRHREYNNAAARRSRTNRRLQEIETMERTKLLTEENQQLRAQMNKLDEDNHRLVERDKQLSDENKRLIEQVKELEKLVRR